MPRGRMGRLSALVGVAALALGLRAAPAQAQGCASCAAPTGCTTGGVCQQTHCPPHFHHCQERPPVICIHCGCPRPVCNPCSLPNFGYFQPCWTPWPLPPDWSHCPSPPPAAHVQLGTPAVVPGIPSAALLQKTPVSSDVPLLPGAIHPTPGGGGLPPGLTPIPEESEGLPVPRPIPAGPGLGKVGP
jgi:hypothetical protein